MKESNTNLTKVCEKHDLPYFTTYHRLKSKTIDLGYIVDLIKKINPKAEVEHGFCLTILLDEKFILYKNFLNKD